MYNTPSEVTTSMHRISLQWGNVHRYLPEETVLESIRGSCLTPIGWNQLSSYRYVASPLQCLHQSNLATVCPSNVLEGSLLLVDNNYPARER